MIHVAGTNGKGSVSLKVARALQEMGYKTGLFTSPHINSFRERVQVNQKLSSQASIVEHCEKIFRAVNEDNMDLRMFEILTMIAFLEFRK